MPAWQRRVSSVKSPNDALRPSKSPDCATTNHGESFDFSPWKLFAFELSHQAKYMVELDDQILSAFDPFADAKDSDAPGAKQNVHIRVQQRNGKKSLTTVQGLKKDYSYEKILKDLKKEFCCNGNVVQDKELGKVIQLQGDQRKNVAHFLVQAGLVKKDQVKIHGF
ncbi:hypothetical protein Nepgr_026827 [Nepenthes gracilis]|uniref:SUI1 domain-containing protein n=1 Tax=Nepenthes gracilis TaxID=150966 RepID=A0AAD3T929_NEPGR|nr:hypothetical protein Nepgr_026827 [Nepenthes gracilis]